MKITANELSESYDLIVIGSGPAGIAVARKYADLARNKRVLIVESGDEAVLRHTALELAGVSATGDNSANAYIHHSWRLLGGTSNVWTGICAPLERRPFLNNEWPIAYSELADYYPEAAKILHLPSEVHASPTEVPIGGSHIVYRPLYYSPARFNRSNQSLWGWLVSAPNVDILFNHTATSALIERERCTGVVINATSRSNHSPLRLDSEKIVVATGGVQNARFLLLSLPKNHRLPVGNHLSMHPHIDNQLEIVLDYPSLRDAIEQFPDSSVNAISLSSHFCAKNNVLSAFYAFPVAGERHQHRILGSTKEVIKAKCHIRSEMPLLMENQVSLSDTEQDFLGQDSMQIHFEYHRSSLEQMHRAMAEQLLKSGLGRMGTLPPDWKVNHGGGHLLCTTRMGRLPETSVVDENCQVHGIRGLYVAGSSVFSTAGAANPTYTIVAC